MKKGRSIVCRCQHCGQSLTVPTTAIWKLGDTRYTECPYCHEETEVITGKITLVEHSINLYPAIACEFCQTSPSSQKMTAMENDGGHLIAVCNSCLVEATKTGYHICLNQEEALDLLILASEKIPFSDPPISEADWVRLRLDLI